ncbi:bifunctional 2-C-methyl-D-erythritol 4-phosphate cytidylyltransferase/2-C-methyl-D-erythritol 2,4-cyclodiphosphate synthase [Xinfangfangia sp. CPCC 101601]|uniref:Bifunctional enzyme IspD/IspF n=1 Tax=Pseudogemmobacter lacusdianii TaxID=3069608 RepID=A0ABU0VUP1_9RHOB|nr:bifunctional 2-C-methyl-D-erythritol 4-phosphate cytidylyltransferase/2-C-methyl-D-erythritol 2,4-cyclodiphosphate synthase [Xinfangfangia sp. CPCC 101601]MDQ2065444.1 bifunctional 2-C-methyl-D-erythritol 4-phosphate cytidylyltransferase/2-C-methyl-D-erythritol 2,4-cyclodiphosphate synthase [Xinfangfangia sp. CPCC 101601]
MSTAVIIVAAGRGSRAGGDLPKQWQSLAGKSVLEHTVAQFGAMQIVLVIHPEDRVRAAALFPELTLVHGGETRAQSVLNALAALEGSQVDRVLIHDGARPFVSQAVITRVIAALDHHPAAAPALVVSDALWRGEAGLVQGTQDRAGLYRAQTPQGFRFPEILAAHRAHPGGALDDVEVARAAGLDVAIVEGDEENMKLTYPGDFAKGEALLKGRKMDLRVGNGYDVHAFCEGDHLWLCGVKIPHSKGLLGHSDADVGMHALTDAIYGALAEGDIGRHFPPSDPQWKGAASHIFLAHAIALAREKGYQLANCDVTLVCEYPKIGPHALNMAAELARIMGVETSRVSVKATTSERLGFTGREEGIASIATCALVKA